MCHLLKTFSGLGRGIRNSTRFPKQNQLPCKKTWQCLMGGEYFKKASTTDQNEAFAKNRCGGGGDIEGAIINSKIYYSEEVV